MTFYDPRVRISKFKETEAVLHEPGMRRSRAWQ